jgi:hypothetical protein
MIAASAASNTGMIEASWQHCDLRTMGSLAPPCTTTKLPSSSKVKCLGRRPSQQTSIAMSPKGDGVWDVEA